MIPYKTRLISIVSKPIKVVVVVVVIVIVVFVKKNSSVKKMWSKNKTNWVKKMGLRKFGVQIILGTKIFGEHICL